MLLPPNTAHSTFALHAQESHNNGLPETLFGDVGRLDGIKRVVLLQGGINQVYSSPLDIVLCVLLGRLASKWHDLMTLGLGGM